jgi:ectoine hydroxylase-related dioxygenase (phytanoyl-CoA dioxygenase family)
MQTLKHSINSSIANSFSKNGFQLFQDVIDTSDRVALEDDYASIVRKYTNDRYETVDEAILALSKSDKSNLYEIYKETSQLISFIKVGISLFERTLGSEGYASLSGNGILIAPPNDGRLAYTWHQEGAFDHKPGTIHFQFPLFRAADLENGTMSALVGSHKLDIQSYQETRCSNDALINRIPKNIDELTNQFEEHHFLMRLNDAYVFNNNLLHRSNLNKSPYPRYSGVIRINRNG